VYVGVPEPAGLDAVLRAPPPNPGPLDAWPAWLLAEYNAERAKLGHVPLRLDDKLCEAAQRRAVELGQFDAPFVEEIAGRAGEEPSARPYRGKYAWAGWRGRFAWSTSFEALADVVTMQMQRPSARLGLFAPAARRIGIGISPRRSAEGVTEYQIVEYVR
jgi:hypothetical protein